MTVYNMELACLHTHSLESLCLAASRISIAGLHTLQKPPKDWTSYPTITPIQRGSFKKQAQTGRMSVSPALLVEMLWGINFALHNGCELLAREAVRDVHARACFELLPDVQLVTAAILNSEELRAEGMMEHLGGVCVSSTVTAPLNKSALTNASFKTKKLPDDIVVAADGEGGGAGGSNKLSPIEEEHKTLAKAVLRLSKGRKKEERERHRSRDTPRKDTDNTSLRSLPLNGESPLDAVTVSVVKNSARYSVDNVEMRHSPPAINGNNSAAPHRRDTGSGEGGEAPRSRPNSFHGALVNPESFSTDL